MGPKTVILSIQLVVLMCFICPLERSDPGQKLSLWYHGDCQLTNGVYRRSKAHVNPYIDRMQGWRSK